MPINIENALKISGWMKVEELEWLATQAFGKKRILEIGSWMGRSTRALADNCAGVVYAVDTWNGTLEDGHDKLLADKGEDYLFNEFKKNKAENCIAVRMESKEALEIFEEQFDMIFIDGAHDYDSVKADILGCLKLLAPNGLLCGHDFDAGRIGVVKAVKELLPTHYKVVQTNGENVGSIWAVK